MKANGRRGLTDDIDIVGLSSSRSSATYNDHETSQHRRISTFSVQRLQIGHIDEYYGDHDGGKKAWTRDAGPAQISIVSVRVS